MKILINEKLSAHKYKTPEGYLICVDSVLARTGKQTYTRNEIFHDGKDEEIEVDRTEEEVFSNETLASFENKPLTEEHPEEDVTPLNYREHAVGFVRDIKRGLDMGKPVMLGTLVITDAEAIEAVESGRLTDLSCGYDCDINDDEHPCQTNIRGNHVALCEQGRAGNARVVDSIKDENLFFYKALKNGIYYLSTDPQKIKKLNPQKIFVLGWVNSEFSDLYDGFRKYDNNEKGSEVALKAYSSRFPKMELLDSIHDVEPRAGEKKEDFIERFMTETKSEYPDIKQRYAVANSYWNRRDSMKDGFGILSFGQENKVRKYCQKYEVDFNKVYKTIEEMNVKYPRMKIDDIIESVLEDVVSGFYDSTKDAYLKLPREEDEIYLYRDYRGQNVYVEFWGRNKYQVTAERDNFKEKYMNENEVADYLDELGARFVRSQRDSIDDIDNKKIKIGSTVVLKNEENNNMSINKVLKEMPDYYLVKNRNDIVHKIYKDKLYLWEVINDSIDDIDPYAEETGALEEEAENMEEMVEDAPEGFDKDYALQERFLKGDINVVEQLWKMNKGSASDLFQKLGYKKDGNYTFYKDDKGYRRVVEFRDFDDIRYYVLKDGKIPRGWTVTKRTYWGDSLNKKDSLKLDKVVKMVKTIHATKNSK